jgi:tetratricopeptide (TPR) repeat protein
MSDVLSRYEAGLNRLLTQLGRDHPRYTEVLVYQQRLLENLARIRLYGDTETSRAERAEILDRLNHLVLEAVGKSFSAILSGSGAVSQGEGAMAAGKGGVLVEGDVHGDVVSGQKSTQADRDREAGDMRGAQGPIYKPTGLVEQHFGPQINVAGDFVEGDRSTTAGGDNVVGDHSGVAVFEYHRKALETARKADDRAAQGAALDDLGSAYAARGDFRQAVDHHEQAVAIARALDDRQAEAIYLQKFGLALLRLADAEPDHRQAHLSRAADVLRQAIELFDMIGAASLLRARACYHLGRCYHRLGRWREAITFLDQARETFSRYKARPELAHTLLELGQLYHQRQDFESAYIYLKDALRLFRRLKDTDGIAVTQEALGSLALQTARLPQAVASLQEARQGYVALRRSERVRAVDDLLQIAHQARQPMGGTTP